MALKLKLEEDGTLVGPRGVTFGRLISMEMDLIERPHALTPTEVRDLTACPFCDAEVSELCRRWRGGARKANHAERVQEALDIAGTVSEGTERYGNSAVGSTTDVQGKETPFGGKEVRPTATQREAEAVARVWTYWLEISGRKQRIDDKRKRIIRSAIALVGEEAVRRALLGLTLSPHHRGQNEQRRQYMEIRYALKGIGDESDDERIEKAISWAAVHSPQQAVDPDKVTRWLEEVRYTMSSPERPERERGTEAWKKLKAAGFKVNALDKPPWARIER